MGEALNVFGGTRIGRNGTVVPGQRLQLANYRNPNEYDAAGPLVLSLMRSDNVANTADQAATDRLDAPIYGEIEYGAGGASETIEVDWIIGSTIAVPGSWCNVRAVFPPLAEIPSVEPVGVWSVAVGVLIDTGIKSPAGSTGSARRTLRQVVDTEGAGVDMAIPLRAIDVTVYCDTFASLAGTTVALNTRAVTAPGPRVGSTLVRSPAGNAAGQSFTIHIPNGARSWRLDRVGGGRYVAVFTLSL
jgi:hypothetical protein